MKQSGSKYFKGKIYDLETLTSLFRSTKEDILSGYNNVKTKITRNWRITGITISQFQRFATQPKRYNYNFLSLTFA